MKKMVLAVWLGAAVSGFAQKDSSATDSVIVRKTTFAGISLFSVLPLGNTVVERELYPIEGIVQRTRTEVRMIGGPAVNVCFSLRRNFSVNTSFGVNFYYYRSRYGMANDVTPASSSGPAVINSAQYWGGEEIYTSAFLDVAPGYRLVHAPRFDLFAGAGVTLSMPGKLRRSPAAIYAIGLSPRLKLTGKTWLQVRTDFGLTSRDYWNFRRCVFLQAGLAHRFDSERKEPRKHPYYIRIYED